MRYNCNMLGARWIFFGGRELWKHQELIKCLIFYMIPLVSRPVTHQNLLFTYKSKTATKTTTCLLLTKQIIFCQALWPYIQVDAKDILYQGWCDRFTASASHRNESMGVDMTGFFFTDRDHWSQCAPEQKSSFWKWKIKLFAVGDILFYGIGLQYLQSFQWAKKMALFV